jgi:ubiquinone/menaquinone biosynthesis C-methylase UbiE
VAVELSRLFHRVVASDSSAAQLSHATARPNVQYVQAAAEQLQGDPGAADLVCAAQALHWFDRPAFYAQAARVLKPSGVLAAWCYGRPRFASPPGRPLPAAALEAANALIEELYSGTLGAYWDDRRTLVERAYEVSQQQAQCI